MNKAALSVSLLLLTLTLSAQTLKRRTAPPTMQTPSCVDRIATTRHTFADSAAASSDKDYRKEAMRLYVELADQGTRVQICSSRKLAANYEVTLALAEFIRRTNMMAKVGGR